MMVLLLLLIIVTLVQLLPGAGDFYAQCVYPVIARPLSFVSGLVPFSVSEVFYTLCLALLLLYPVVSRMMLGRLWRSVLFVEAKLILGLYVWFYATWGLNYAQSDFYRRTAIQRASYDAHALLQFADDYVASLNEAYCIVSDKDETLVCREVVEAYRDMSTTMGIHAPYSDSPHAKTMLFTPLFSKVGVSGTMGPYFDEFLVSRDLLPCEYAFTYAHELSHLLGISREGEANFYAYEACIRSQVQEVRFSGYMSILHYVLREVRNLDAERYETLHSQIRPEVLELDRERIDYHRSRYSNTLGSLQDWLYDHYLRFNRIEDGRQNYSEVIGLILSTRPQ